MQRMIIATQGLGSRYMDNWIQIWKYWLCLKFLVFFFLLSSVLAMVGTGGCNSFSWNPFWNLHMPSDFLLEWSNSCTQCVKYLGLISGKLHNFAFQIVATDSISIFKKDCVLCMHVSTHKIGYFNYIWYLLYFVYLMLSEDLHSFRRSL